MANFEQYKQLVVQKNSDTNFAVQPYTLRSLKDSNIGADWSTRKWQKKAWSLYEQLGEVKFAAEYFGNAVSQAKINVVEVDGSKDVANENVVVAEEAAVIIAQLEGEHHGLDQTLRQLAISLFVCGEVWLVSRKMKQGGRNQRNSDGSIRTVLKVVPAMDVTSKHGVDGYIDPTNEKADLDGFVAFESKQTRLRIYRPDPRSTNVATSNLQGVLHVGTTLLMLDRLVRGTIKSRTHAGIMKVPSEINFNQNPGFKNQNGDSFAAQMMEALAAPIEDEDSARSVVPFIMRGNADYLSQVEMLSLERNFDEFLPELIEKYTRRMALGLDIPAEVLLGLGNANHWASWFLSAEFVRIHAKPLLNLITGVLTKKLLHPALALREVPEYEKYCFSFDELALVVQANKSQNAKDAKAMGLISDEAFRHHLGFCETDAPNENDVLPQGSPAQRQPVDVENPANIPTTGEDQ